MNYSLTDILKMLWVIFIVSTPFALRAQGFSVESFRPLPNDVTAFIDPVRDLNDEGCALIKVQADPDFVFSTPLGIVKRLDNVGEIWIYLPKGSKKITIKHPRWGVLRDFTFPSKLESHVSYELKIKEPFTTPMLADAIEVPVTVHDTLVVVRTDTLIVAEKREKTPVTSNIMATLAFGGRSKTLMGGLLLSVMRQHGGYVHISTDFGRLGKITGSCDMDGYMGSALPYYTGRTRHSSLLVTGGAIHRVSKVVNLFEGIGYGYDKTAWQLSESNGGGYLKNTGYSWSGFCFEFGGICNFKRLSVSASVVSIEGKQWYGSIGIGFRLGKFQKK